MSFRARPSSVRGVLSQKPLILHTMKLHCHHPWTERERKRETERERERACARAASAALSSSRAVAEERQAGRRHLGAMGGFFAKAAVADKKEGVARFKCGDYEGAAAKFEEATTSAPSDAAAFLWLGHARLKLGDRTGAVTSYEQALELARNCGDKATAHNGLGLVPAGRSKRSRPPPSCCRRIPGTSATSARR